MKPPAVRCTPQIAAAIRHMAETQRRINRIDADAFDKQREFVRDEALRQACLCTRRAGKSRGGALKLFRTAVKYPGSRSRYIGLTRQTAKDIMWDVLKEVSRDLDLGAVFNETELKVTLPNGSSFRLIGMDAGVKELHKALGGKLKGVLIDEAASFRVDLRALIKDFIGPATIDEGGWIAMSGTPDPDEARGFFYDVTTNREPGWLLHSWDTSDNPHMREQWLAELARIEREDPKYMETAEFLCMFRAKWPELAGGRVYRFDAERNLADLTERLTDGVVAVDIGWNDASSVTGAGWREGSKDLYLVHSDKWPGLMLDALAEKVREGAQKLIDRGVRAENIRYVVDGANKTAVMELRRRYGLPLHAVEKQEKNMWIRMMNTDFVRGLIKVVRGACKPLVEEYTGADEAGVAIKGSTPLVWDKRAQQRRPPVLKEDPRCKNDCADSGLYAFRSARNFMEEAPEDTRLPTPDEQVQAFWTREREKRSRDADEDGLQIWGG